MFDRVMKWLQGDADQQAAGFEEADVRLAIATLFAHLIAVDGEVKPVERERRDILLRERFGLNDIQLSTLAAQGEAMDQRSNVLFPYAVVINRTFNEGERHQIFLQMQSLAMADGHVHELERDMLNHVKVLLKLE